MHSRGQLPSMHSLSMWNSMIQASVRDGLFSESLNLYCSMVSSGLHGDKFTFPFVAKACAKMKLLRDGSKVHAHSILMGYEGDIFVQTSLMDMYSKCSALRESRRLFDEMPTRSLVSWNSMIGGYGRGSLINASFELLGQMRGLGLRPNASTFVGLISGCSSPSGWALPQGLSLHCYGIKLGLSTELCISNLLISMYMCCGLVDTALSLFELLEERSTVSWTTIIGGYVRLGDHRKALETFNRMRLCDIGLDAVSLVNLTSACSLSGSLPQASSAHALMIKSGCVGKSSTSNSLLNSYAKCHDLISARKVFDFIPEKDIFSWTSMLAGYVHNGCANRALGLFEKLLMEDIEPSEVTVTTILSACADFGSLDMGQKVEAYVKSNKLELSCRVQTSLINMYCKCGSIERAREIFHLAPHKDVALWSCMINGYAMHGMGREALTLYEEMKRQGEIVPDAIVFTSILSACCHSGLIEEGFKFFSSMQDDFHIDPSIEHYFGLVDMLSRGGQLDIALNVIQKLPTKVQTQVWSPFLSAYRSHCGLHLKDFGGENLPYMRPQNCGNYILMSHTFASFGKWKDAMEIRRLMDERGFVKKPGLSKLESSSHTD
uniref:Pentatricopeptide repeat-containing protein At5g39350 n=1 Tax=Anthurium amnicola TaxID=1678845 RepID=A0A1D1Z0J7_9ARAE